jgi:hypothetical protein
MPSLLDWITGGLLAFAFCALMIGWARQEDRENLL